MITVKPSKNPEPEPSPITDLEIFENNFWGRLKFNYNITSKHVVIAVMVIVIALLFFGCMTPGKVTNYLNEHKDFNAQNCAINFPAVQTSTTVTDTVYQTHNVDYTGYVDSLVVMARQSASKRIEDSVEASRSHAACQTVVARQSREIFLLKEQISSLQLKYKPCKPDTLVRKTTIYVKDSAEAFLTKQTQAQMLVLTAKYETEHKWKRKLLYILIVIIVGAGVYTYMKFKP